MRFSEMKYEKPDFSRIKITMEEIARDVSVAETFEKADQLFHAFDELSRSFSTQYNLVYIRHTINTEDKYYDQQMDFFNEVLPEMDALDSTVKKAFYNSIYKTQFEKKYGELYFKNIEIKLKSVSQEIIPDMQEENKLSTEYAKLLASAQIEFDGGKKTISEMSLYKQSNNDEIRNAAWQAEGQFYQEHAAKLDELYDKLVYIRNNQAKKMGYDNYVELGYYRRNRNSYNKKDVERFRSLVIKYIVPVADRLYQEQAKRTSLPYPLSFADAAIKFRSGNPMPNISSDEIIAHGSKLYHELSPETSEFIDVMYNNDLLDVLSKKGKAGGGYCTELSDYKVPFIFANFNGTADDVEVMTHEAGHAFAFYQARNIFPSDYCSPTYETCECHSMSMEFFAWKWAEGFFGKQTDKFKYAHLSDAIKFIPYGTMVDHFQHSIYECPEMKPEERHAEWRRLLAIYMPWIRLDDSVFYGEGKSWQRQHHIYEYPLYYIDYCLAQTIALEFWTCMQQNYKEAWDKYLMFVNCAGTKTFNEIISSAGLDNPFYEDALKTVAMTATNWLDKIPVETL